MTDVVPAMLEGVQESFHGRLARDSRIMRVNGRIRDGTATLKDAHLYSQRVGTALSNALKEHITLDALPNEELYFNIADRIIMPTMTEDYDLVNEVAANVQKVVDQKNGIGLGSAHAAFPKERISGLIEKLVDPEVDVINRLVWLNEPIVNNSEAFFDDFIRENASFRQKAGLNCTIMRITAPGCCEWCASMAGIWEYGQEPKDIYKRHEYCRCDVIYNSERSYQDVWTKEAWSTPDQLAARRAARLATPLIRARR